MIFLALNLMESTDLLSQFNPDVLPDRMMSDIEGDDK